MYLKYMYAFTSIKEVSKGLLTADNKRTLSLSKRELRLHESERVSPNAWIFRINGKWISEHFLSAVFSLGFWEDQGVF